MSAKDQRAALITTIRRIFPDVQVECSDLSWLRVPEIGQLDGQLGPIFDALKRHRGHKDFATGGRRLACDIVIPSRQVIVEYDERQHFSVPRAIALRHYPGNIAVGFDVAQWIAHCEAIAAVDNDPPYRDEQRAFYDSVRDVLAGKNGYRVVRLKHGVALLLNFGPAVMANFGPPPSLNVGSPRHDRGTIHGLESQSGNIRAASSGA